MQWLSRREAREIAAGDYDRLDVDPEVCVYCGEPATTLDHAVPIVFAAAGTAAKFNKLLVPACHHCNMVAGHHLHYTIGDRRRWIQSRLVCRYHIDIPKWGRQDIAELGPRLRRHIRAAIKETERWQKRRNWRNAPSIDRVILAEEGSSFAELGPDIALQDALKKLSAIAETPKLPASREWPKETCLRCNSVFFLLFVGGTGTCQGCQKRRHRH